MKLTSDEAREVIYSDHKDFQMVPGTEKIIDYTRWSIVKEAIFKYKPTDKFYLFVYSIGATESQDESPYEYDDYVKPTEVSLQKVMREEWVAVNKEK